MNGVRLKSFEERPLILWQAFGARLEEERTSATTILRSLSRSGKWMNALGLSPALPLQ